MNFFEQQEAARSASRRLIVLFVIAVACTVLAVDGVIALTWGLFASGQLGDLFTTIAELPAKFYWTTSAVTTLVILTMTWRRMNQLEDGGTAVASGIGAVPIRSNTTDPLERRLRNVVEEMAIASGVRVPALYVLDEKGINAFSAGFDSSQAVVVVTRGALESLNRDELQGVVGHEFSHILNGDVAVNIRMMGVLAGIVTIGSVGLFILRGRVRSRGKGGLYLVILGALLVAVGTIGLFFARLIKMSISREREFLADAASVQFTRNPEGIAGALDEINDGSLRSFIHAETAEEVSHMFFCSCAGPTVGGWFATHPPIGERIQRVDPQFKSTAYRKKRAPAAEGAPATVTSAVSGGGTAAATHPAPKVPLAAFVGTAGAAQLQSTREA
ncbi:MAG TPA: M48 family metallopeptidase, partial [Gemmatimonadales bacterium]